MIWLSEDDVAALLDPRALVAGIAGALGELAEGRIAEPIKTRIEAPELGATYTVFPAFRPSAGLATAKVLSGVLANPARGLPKIHAVVVAMDAATGEIAAIMGGRWLTALRTAAATAVAVRALRPGRRFPRVGLLGTGVQGVSHARVFAAEGLGEGFLVASASGDAARAAAFAGEVERDTGLPAEPVAAADLARHAEVVIAATLSPVPLVGEEVRADAVVASVGQFRPGDMEIEPSLCAGAAMVVADHPGRFLGHWERAPDILAEFRDRLVALHDLATGRVPPPPAGRRAVFLSEGRAFEDNVAAGLVIAAAKAAGRGLALP